MKEMYQALGWGHALKGMSGHPPLLHIVRLVHPELHNGFRVEWLCGNKCAQPVFLSEEESVSYDPDSYCLRCKIRSHDSTLERFATFAGNLNKENA